MKMKLNHFVCLTALVLMIGAIGLAIFFLEDAAFIWVLCSTLFKGACT